MEIVNFLALVWGFSFIIISLAFLISPKNIEYMLQLMQERNNAFIFGMVNVMLGVALILSYNTWDLSWKVIITLLGWVVLTRGIVCLYFPEAIKKIIELKIKIYKDWFSVVFTACAVLGCALVYLGQLTQ